MIFTPDPRCRWTPAAGEIQPGCRFAAALGCSPYS
jgi:hypothetical protein